MPLLADHDIICVSVMDWDHPFQSSRHHLMRALARHNRVLFVDNQVNPLKSLLGLSAPRERQRLARWLNLSPNPRQVDHKLWVYTPPPVIPMGRIKHPQTFAALYRINQQQLLRGVHSAVRSLAMHQPILWISFNVLSSEALIGRLGEALVIYHCTDEISAFPGISPFAESIERRLLAGSDLVLTSSKALREDKQQWQPNCHYVPNGADTALFKQALAPQVRPHPFLNGLQAPRLGFAGNIEDRFDFDLVAAVADAHPEWSIVLAGPVAPAQRTQLDRLRRYPNIHWGGLLQREELPAFLAGIDVALIPYVHSRQTRAIYPLKLNEYLAAGKPVATTGFADLSEFSGCIEVGDGPQPFAQAVARALMDTPAKQKARIKLADANTWEARIEAMSALIAEELITKKQSA